MTQVLPNKAASDEAFKALETANLDDFFVQRLPAGKRRMYLGLFKYSKAAHRRIATLKKAGIKAMVRL
jgi:hypothetical protein